MCESLLAIFERITPEVILRTGFLELHYNQLSKNISETQESLSKVVKL